MCGIAGIVVGPADRVGGDVLRRASASIRHRGPDDEGFLTWSPGERAWRGREPNGVQGRVGFVHRRLSILDLSELGWQPMTSPDGRYHLIYNGEVYNYVELRAELERAGHRFVSHSDTEVMLAALAAWGVDAAVRRFEGMFAFALLDTADGTLTLARDAFGIKPLYYVDSGGRFGFASEIKALFALGAGTRRANPAAIFEYLVYGTCEHGEETSFSDVQQLPPAGILVVDVKDVPRVVARRSFWAPTVERPIDVSPDEASALVRDAFLGNVSRHLRSDVPLGAALSGGIDSSAIVTSMRRVAPDLELHAFSYLADDARINEERWVRAAAGAAGATVHPVHVEGDDLTRDVDALIVTQDEPFGGTSMYAQYRIFRAADEAGVKVMLDGQGADELLGGYAVYLGPHVAGLMSRGRVWTAAQLMLATRHQADARMSGVAHYVAGASTPRWLKARLGRRVRQSAVPSWIDGAWFDGRGVAPGARTRDPGPGLRGHLAHSLRSSLLSLLRYEDRNSMAFSVESRVPFLTTGFADLVLSLPDTALIAPDGTRKDVLRRAMRGIVPDVVLDRRDKIGFQTPERSLLYGAGGWAASVLASDAARALPGIRPDALRRVSDSMAAGSPNGAATAVPLWRWLNLIRWTELFDVQYA